ncbi:uncharacterized protein E6C27_scaffold1302G00020 [Cucumis melo var. makuwa]|uniref:CACTA en-spm transposon protein n=1 Tax=Cucumis melo var. makuwa TaxID=1194695 RepID=A0A5A7TFH2_CUCMM|nr:uncharacterized protein E6C27_scaffold1302G00020 [Cucumis melo var. makuwa]
MNVLEIVVSHRVADHVEDDTLCSVDVHPTEVERLIVLHVDDDFINNDDEQFSFHILSYASFILVYMSPDTMSQFLFGFNESDGLFDFNAEEFNTIADMSYVDDTSDASRPTAPTSRRRKHSRNLELERYVV